MRRTVPALALLTVTGALVVAVFGARARRPADDPDAARAARGLPLTPEEADRAGHWEVGLHRLGPVPIDEQWFQEQMRDRRAGTGDATGDDA